MGKDPENTIQLNSNPLTIKLGPKLSEDPYTQKDRDILKTIEAQLAHAIDRIQQVQESTKATTANNHKTRFLAQLCHDFRTPLHGILGFSKHIEANPETNAQDHAKLIHHSAQHLLRSVSDLMDIEKIEQGDIPYHPAPFQLHNLLQEIEETTTLLIDEKPITFILKNQTDPTLTLKSDNTLIKRILLNLISNAIKFTQKGTITLKISNKLPSLEGVGGGLILELADTGTGFDPEKAATIFQPYTQLAGPNKSEGIGLGLSIVKAFVDKLNGTITVKSAVGQGTEFCITLPVTEETVQKSSNEPAQENLKHLKVLLCDDNGINRVFAKMALAHLTRFTCVSSGEEAIDAAKETQFDIIFLDIQLNDGMDGIETLKILKNLPHKTQPIYCALTAQPDFHNLSTAKNEGFDTFLPKPFSEKEIIRFLERTFR